MSELSKQMDVLLKRLFPICRSITGSGVRETLAIIQEHIPLKVHEVPSGTPVLDWIVPQEWDIKDAWVRNSAGKKVIDFSRSNLHVMSYSIPVRERMNLAKLKEHLYSLPDDQDTIPYRTSYYAPNWGFCLTHREFLALPEDEYEVVIDSSLANGSLTYGEYYIKGQAAEEVLLSCYVCHPSMANDNLSGPVLLTFLAKELARKQNRLHYSYRLIFIPETIGALVWLSRNQAVLPRIKHGLVATCCGDSGPFTYKQSRRGDAPIDQAAQEALTRSGRQHRIRAFYPIGSDERQFCSPGFNLPVGSLMRTPYGEFSEYHTSRDDLELVSGRNISESFELYEQTLNILEQAPRYRNLLPFGEPQLGRRDLYSSIGGMRHSEARGRAIQWLLNFSDGEHLVSDIARRSGLEETLLTETAEFLVEKGLLQRVR